MFYFDLWWFETLVCFIKTIHFPVISLTIFFFSVISITMGKFEKHWYEKLKFYNFYHNFFLNLICVISIMPNKSLIYDEGPYPVPKAINTLIKK